MPPGYGPQDPRTERSKILGGADLLKMQMFLRSKYFIILILYLKLFLVTCLKCE